MSPIAISPYASYYHCDVMLIMTSFATELATPSITDVRTPYRQEKRRKKIDRKKKPQGKNIMSASATQGAHKDRNHRQKYNVP